MMKNNERQIKAVLWDMDGVLIDSEPFYNITIGDMLRARGFEYGPKEIAKVTGASYKNFVALLGLTDSADEISRLYVEALMKGVKQVSDLVPGLEDFLRGLKAMGMKMAIGSSSPTEVVSLAVERFGLGDWIEVIVTGSDAEGKPAPDIYLKCAEKLGVAPSECLVMEDSMNGIKSGKSAGMAVCAFTGTGRHNFDLSGADFEIADYSAETLQEVMGFINQN